jgi:hypothetical protein
MIYVGGTSCTSFWTIGRSAGLSPRMPNNTLGYARIPEVNWRNQAMKSGYIRICFLLQNLLTASKLPPNSTSNWSQCPDAKFYQSKPLSQLQNRHDPLLRLGFRFLNFLTAALLPNVNSMVKGDLLIVGVLKSNIFSITYVRPIFLVRDQTTWMPKR